MFISNGRIRDDCGVGKTITTYNTTIDYVIGSLLLMQFVEAFKIVDYDSLFSDVHCGLHALIRFSKIGTASTVNTTRDVERLTFVKPGIWKKERRYNFVRCIDRDRVN